MKELNYVYSDKIESGENFFKINKFVPLWYFIKLIMSDFISYVQYSQAMYEACKLRLKYQNAHTIPP